MAAGIYSDKGVANEIATRTEQIRTRMDQIVKKGLITADMNADPTIVEAFGMAQTASLPTMSTSGLGDYDEDQGYPVTPLKVTMQNYTLDHDRGVCIDVDRKQQIQSGGVASAATAAAILSREKIIPEIDAARISDTVTKVKANDSTHVVESATALTAANIISEIGKGLDMIFEEWGTDSGATIYLNHSLRAILRGSTEVTKVRNIQDGGRSLNLETNDIDGNIIKFVPSARMKTAYTYYDGVTDGETDGGFVPASGAGDINFLICAPGCAQGVVVFSDSKYLPAQYQKKDADSFMFRIYHGVVVTKNQGTQGIYASVKTAGSREPESGEQTTVATASVKARTSTKKTTV